ncbi:hypothetical protein CPB83DRAFT_858581 [Crepidotus variabilis]|uniref:Uncharacterized protein n=1 Tax=Crepidotus variabilis TaxID=179855 RepID=A0A9P6EBS6_9AGAR|nr:hypothetical protein CPB83DRAFT_858581 [Crepidotus variabilis]
MGSHCHRPIAEIEFSNMVLSLISCLFPMIIFAHLAAIRSSEVGIFPSSRVEKEEKFFFHCQGLPHQPIHS